MITAPKDRLEEWFLLEAIQPGDAMWYQVGAKLDSIEDAEWFRDKCIKPRRPKKTQFRILHITVWRQIL